MKHTLLTLSLVAAIAIAGCDHSTNSEPAPRTDGLNIVTPTNDSFVDGVVSVKVAAKNVAVSRVEMYVNGELYDTKTSGDLEFAWNTSQLPSNSVHTIKVLGYNSVNSYTSSAPVTVRIK